MSWKKRKIEPLKRGKKEGGKRSDEGLVGCLVVCIEWPRQGGGGQQMGSDEGMSGEEVGNYERGFGVKTEEDGKKGKISRVWILKIVTERRTWRIIILNPTSPHLNPRTSAIVIMLVIVPSQFGTVL